MKAFTDGARLVQVVMEDHFFKSTKDGPILDQGIVDDLARRIDAAIATAREEKDKAWLEEIASHGGWVSDVICTRCMPHRECKQLNLSAAGPSECGYCAYLQGKQDGLAAARAGATV